MPTTISSPNETEMHHLKNGSLTPEPPIPIPAPFRRPEIEEAAEFNAVLANPENFSRETFIELFASPPLDSERLEDLEIVICHDDCLDSIRSQNHIPSLFEPGKANGLQTQIYFLDFEERRPVVAETTVPTCPVTGIPIPRLPIPPRLRTTQPAFKRLVGEFEIPMTFVEGIFQDLIWDGSGCFVRKNRDSNRVERIGMFFQSKSEGLTLITYIRYILSRRMGRR